MLRRLVRRLRQNHHRAAVRLARAQRRILSRGEYEPDANEGPHHLGC